MSGLKGDGSTVLSFPTIGRSVEHDGQRYVLAGYREHIRRDGGKTTLVGWQTICPCCGRSFVAVVPARAPKFQPSRRCARCKQPGKPVKGKS